MSGVTFNIFLTRVLRGSGVYLGKYQQFFTSMAAEDLLINDSSNGEAVETVSEGLPQLNVEPALAYWNAYKKNTLLERNYKRASGLCDFIETHTHRRIRRCGWWKHTRGCPWAGKSFLGIWSCRPIAGRWSPATASLCLRSRPGKGSLPPEGSHHIQTASVGLCTAHGYHLKKEGEKQMGREDLSLSIYWKCRHKDRLLNIKILHKETLHRG